MMMTLQQALAWVQARIPQARLVGDGALPLARIHTDTRSLQGYLGKIYAYFQTIAGLALGLLAVAGFSGIVRSD